MTLAFVVPGLDEAASEKAIAILQNRLSQEQEAALVLKHAHWNVTGPNFIAVHEMLDPEVEAVLAQADETAERIATLGGTPDGRADAIVRNRTWKSFDAEGRVGTEEYLKALIEYYDAFIADDRKAIAELDELDVIRLQHHPGPRAGTRKVPVVHALSPGISKSRIPWLPSKRGATFVSREIESLHIHKLEKCIKLPILRLENVAKTAFLWLEKCKICAINSWKTCPA